MAYTDDAVRAKLSALNETQEGIVTVAQWIMFHRRHANRTAELWMSRLKDSTSSKRLNMIYLANEVVQQSKARKKNEFVDAFSPILVDATSYAYKGATIDIQQKLRRVIEVWRQRQIFDIKVQEAVENAVDELDRSRSSGKKATLGGSLFGSSSSVPPDLQPLLAPQNALTKADSHAKPAVATANTEYAKLTDPANPVPTPPVHAARLSALLKNLAAAEGAVAEKVRSRNALVLALDRLLQSNQKALGEDTALLEELEKRKASIEKKKREVEDGIMRGLSAEDNHHSPVTRGGLPEPSRPDIEALTPPPVESLTPVGTPPHYTTTTGADVIEEQRERHDEWPLDPRALAREGIPVVEAGKTEFLSGLTHQSMGMNGTSASPEPQLPTAKRRKMSAGVYAGVGRNGADEFAAFKDGDEFGGLIDPDVADMLGS